MDSPLNGAESKLEDVEKKRLDNVPSGEAREVAGQGSPGRTRACGDMLRLRGKRSLGGRGRQGAGVNAGRLRQASNQASGRISIQPVSREPQETGQESPEPGSAKNRDWPQDVASQGHRDCLSLVDRSRAATRCPGSQAEEFGLTPTTLESHGVWELLLLACQACGEMAGGENHAGATAHRQGQSSGCGGSEAKGADLPAPLASSTKHSNQRGKRVWLSPG